MDAAELYAVDAACPLLGLAADPQTHHTYPHPGHRCRATAAPAMINPWKQAAHCLSLSFKTCNRYVAWQAEKALAAQPGPPGANGDARRHHAARPEAAPLGNDHPQPARREPVERVNPASRRELHHGGEQTWVDGIR